MKLPVWRVPAGELEGLVTRQIVRAAELMADASLSRQDLRSMVERVTVHQDRIEIVINNGDPTEAIIVPARLISRSGEKRLSTTGDDQPSQPDAALIKLNVRAFQARQLIEEGDASALLSGAAKLGLSSAYFGVLLRLSYLAPDIIAAILDGRQPMMLDRQRLARIGSLPLCWQAQRTLLGFT